MEFIYSIDFNNLHDKTNDICTRILSIGSYFDLINRVGSWHINQPKPPHLLSKKDISITL